MSKVGVEAYMYLGVVSKILGDTEEERLEYRIEADIPGVIKGVNAFPRRDVLDEPKIGDPIVLMSLDPEFNSYYLYWKLKENDFTGFRACGKEFSITPDHILIEVYDKGTWEKPDDRKYKDGEEILNDKGERISMIEMKDSGEITIQNKAGTVVKVLNTGDIEVKTAGHNIDTNMEGGTCTLHNGTLELGGVMATTEGGGQGFVNVPIWGYPGSPIPYTNTIKLIG